MSNDATRGCGRMRSVIRNPLKTWMRWVLALGSRSVRSVARDSLILCARPPCARWRTTTPIPLVRCAAPPELRNYLPAWAHKLAASLRVLSRQSAMYRYKTTIGRAFALGSSQSTDRRENPLHPPQPHDQPWHEGLYSGQ
jgi:hypothetical protein